MGKQVCGHTHIHKHFKEPVCPHGVFVCVFVKIDLYIATSLAQFLVSPVLSFYPSQKWRKSHLLTLHLVTGVVTFTFAYSSPFNPKRLTFVSFIWSVSWIHIYAVMTAPGCILVRGLILSPIGLILPQYLPSPSLSLLQPLSYKCYWLDGVDGFGLVHLLNRARSWKWLFLL